MILLNIVLAFGMSPKWDLITNDAYPLVKFKFAKSFIDERIPPKNRRRGAFVGKTNRQKYLSDDGYYRFSVKGIVFTNQEGSILQNISVADADKLVNPFYRYFNKKNSVTKNIFNIEQYKEFISLVGYNNLVKRAEKMGMQNYLKEVKNIKTLKICLLIKYKEGILFFMTKKGILLNDRNAIWGLFAYLVKKNERWKQYSVHLKWGSMANNIRGFIEMVQGDMSQITTTVDDGKNYPLVTF